MTTGPCVTRVANSNSGQPKPQRRGVAEPTTTTKPQGRGGDAGAKSTTTGPAPQWGGAGQ